MNTAIPIPTRSKVIQPHREAATKPAGPFFRPVLQPKLTVGPVDDHFEREADAVADKVMRMRDNEAVHTQSSSVTIQPKRAACEEEELHRKEDDEKGEPMVQLKRYDDFPVQRKCIECEEEEKLQRKKDSKGIRLKSAVDYTVQRKCEHCEEEEKQKLQLKSAPDYSIQKKCTECEEEERMQRKESAAVDTLSISPAVQQTIQSGGSPLDLNTRTFMESRFGYDFSKVRIHNDSLGHQSSADINALAYTHGHHIAFAAGKYQPNSYSGRQLLAHELTHIIQQNGNKNDVNKKINHVAAHNTVQRAYWTEPGNMALRRRLPFRQGDEIHAEILRNLRNHSSNTDLYTEAPVPNADNLGAANGKQGSADMYKGSSTVGVKFKERFKPEVLPDVGGVYRGTTRYGHESNARPRIENGKVDLRNAPDSVKAGELKPFGSLLDKEYQAQLNGYLEGYKISKDEIGNMASSSKYSSALKPAGGRWRVSIKSLGKNDIVIPEEYRIGSSTARLRTLVLIDDFGKPYLSRTGRRVTGRLYLAYRNDQQGMWNYVYAPEQPFQASQIPQNIADMQVDLNALVTPLRDVRIQPKLNKGQPTTNRPPLITHAPKTVNPVVQRKGEQTENKDSFKYDKWEETHQAFIKKYKAIPKKDKGEAEVAIAEEKTQHQLSVKFGFQDVQETTKQKENEKVFKQMKFWANPLSSIIGRLRQIFGTAYVKIYGGVEKLKAFVKGLIDKLNAPDGGGLVGAVIKIAVKIFKFVGQYFFDKTIGLILTSMKDGVIKKLVSFIESLIPDDVEAFIKKIQDIQKKFEESAVMQITQIIDKLLGPYREVFEKIEYIKSIADKAQDIITWVRWGARLLACASPPAIGCLWALAEELLERMAAKILTSCRVMQTIGPKVAKFLEGIDRIRNIPIEVARFVIEKINSFLPDGWQDTFPLPPLSDLSSFVSDYKQECGRSSGDPITEERQKILEIITEIGHDKFKAFLDMMNKRGAGPWVLLTLERMQEIAEALKTVSIEDLKNLAQSTIDPDSVPVSLQELLKHIQKYTKQEMRTRAQYYAEQRAKAYASKVKAIAKDPYPAKAQLMSDLNTLDWSLGSRQYQLAMVNKNRIIYGRTGEGKRVGAYFRTLATEIGGKKVTKIVDNSIFMNLDDIKCMDGIGAFLIGNTKVTILPEIIVCTESKVAVKAGEGIESGAFLNLQIIDESADTSAKTVTRKPAANTVPPVSKSVYQTLQSTGHPLAFGTRSFMEARMGYDFSRVQIHNDALAHRSSSDINAQAYTHGQHIVFASGQYQPHTSEGKKLLAHELTHVVQQNQNASLPIRKKDAPVDSKKKEAQLRKDFLAIRSAIDAASPTDAEAKKTIQQKAKQFIADFANYHPTKQINRWYDSDYPGKDDFAYLYANVYSLTEVNELAGRLQFIGLPTEAASFYKLGFTSTSFRLPRQRDDEFYASFTEAALQHVDTSSPAKALGSLPFLLSSFAYIVGEIAKMDPSKIVKDKSMSIFPEEDAGKYGFWSEWTFFQSMRNHLGTIYGGMQLIIQSQMDTVIKELDATGEAPSIPIVVDTLNKIASNVPQSAAFKKPSVDLKAFSPRDSSVVITKTAFTGKGGKHKDFFDKSIKAASVKIEYYDKDQKEGKEKELPIIIMHQIRREQLAFIQSFYGLDAKGKKIAGKQHPAELMGAGKTFSLFSIDDWRQFLDKKFDDLTKNQKQSNANAFMELIQLIKSYMKAFTIHTPYNIDDFGDNYLTQNFPRALTGQLIHDCGVYALKTAYLLSLISTKLNLKFQYIVLPNHVGLIITGKDIPVFIMHNDDFTVLPISEQQFDDLSLTNKHMILNDRGIKAYEDAKKKKQEGPIFTVDKLKDAWVKDTKAKKLKGPVTDEQFIAEEAANLFVPKTDMPFALQEINAKNFNPRLKLAEIKKKMFDEYKRMVRAHELFNPKDPSQFNLRYLSLSVDIKNFNNKILLPYWNGKASSQWQTLTQQLQKLQKADDKKAYIAVLKSYRASFGKEVDDMFKRYEPINNEKATIHLFIDVKDPDPLNKGARLSVGERGLTEPWQNAFMLHLMLLDARIQGLTIGTETMQTGTDITPAFVEPMPYYP